MLWEHFDLARSRGVSASASEGELRSAIINQMTTSERRRYRRVKVVWTVCTAATFVLAAWWNCGESAGIGLGRALVPTFLVWVLFRLLFNPTQQAWIEYQKTKAERDARRDARIREEREARGL